MISDAIGVCVYCLGTQLLLFACHIFLIGGFLVYLMLKCQSLRICVIRKSSKLQICFDLIFVFKNILTKTTKINLGVSDFLICGNQSTISSLDNAGFATSTFNLDLLI